MSLALEGTLADVGLCDLLRLVAREKRSGTLRVMIDGSAWSFALDDGQLTGVRADQGPEEPALEPTLMTLVRHRRGTFRLDPPSADDPEGEGDVPVSGVPADALATAGDAELVRFAERLAAAGGEDGCPQRDGFPSEAQMEALDAPARAVFALLNGERTLGELIVRSELDPSEALDALERLVADGLVKTRPAEARAPARVGPALGWAAGQWRDWLAAALPLLLLLVWLGVPSPGASGGTADPFEIRRDPLAEARAAHELERLRAAVEAHRFAEGAFPERLQTLVQGGYVPITALTDAQGRPYYYARRDDGFVLLAPER